MKKKPTAQSAFFNRRVLIGLFAVLIGLFLAFVGFGAFSNSLASQGQDSPAKKSAEKLHAPATRVIPAYHNDISPPLRELPSVWPPLASGREHEATLNPKLPHRHVDAPDPVVQDKFFQGGAPRIPGPILNFNGIPYSRVVCDSCAPPDPNGEVGKVYYVQLVNKAIQVFNKTTGASVLGPVSINSFWSGFAGPCNDEGAGDPIVVYDQLADRWVISQFAIGESFAPQYECIAVSITGDPTGSYYRYGFGQLTDDFLDYPKLGVWPDGYYMSSNIFDTFGVNYFGPQAFVFDRAKMLVGDPSATAQTPGITGGSMEETFLPADVDGIISPFAGAANPYVQWPSGSPLVYKIYKYHVDFDTPANSTFTLFATPSAAAFTELCPTTRECVPEPNGSTLDAIADRLMFRNAYRNINGGTLVNNYTVSSNGVAGIRWFELRNVNAGPVTAPFQQSTYQPSSTWRWNGSAAMDNQGNLAVGFSVSSSSVVPGLRYAGRLVTDPINTLAQGEAVLFAGTGSQTGSANRWGDYSDLTVDPVDDCTFWYTNEFYPSGSTSYNWRTRIGNFKFPDCTMPAKGTAHFIITFCDGGAPLPNALVSVGANLLGSSLSNGLYDVNLIPGNHAYAISKPGFDGVRGGFTIINGQTTNIPICLSGDPVIAAAGSTLVSESCSPVNMVIDPFETVTVTFKLVNNGGASTTNLVATLQNNGGVTPITTSQSYGVIHPGNMAGRDFAFTASGNCGGTLTATLQLQDGVNNLGTVSYQFALGIPVVSTFNNPAFITIPSPGPGPATPYPSNITVSGVTGTVQKLTVTLNGLNGQFPFDHDILLVGPGGQKLIIMSDIGANNEWNNATISLDDSAAALLSHTDANPTGTYKPTNYGAGDTFPAPAPVGLYQSPAVVGSATFASVFNGINPNGTWSLYVVDDNNYPGAGSISGGWTLHFTTPTLCTTNCNALAMTGAVSRKTHGAAGNFDIDLTSTTGVECRSGGATNDFTMIVSFAGNVTVTGSPQAQVTFGTGCIGSGGACDPNGAVTVSGNLVTVPLTTVADQQTMNVRLNAVNSASLDAPAINVTIPITRLLGDTNGNRAVNASDVTQTKARIGQAVTSANFRSDINFNGSINSADASQVKANSGHAVP